MSHLRIKNMSICFPKENNNVVQNLSYSVRPGQVLGIVGESGCGKSMSSYAVMGLLPKGAHVTRGEIQYKHKNLLTLSHEEHRHLRTTDLAMIFQNPSSCLNPYLTVARQMTESVILFQKQSKKAALKKAEALLERVQISDPDKRLNCYPHELSGGMCQRVMIAMMLMQNPSILIADEPTTALDVTVQSQILSLLSDLVTDPKQNLGIVLISHDIGVIANMADDIVVMYSGSAMESGPTDDVLREPRHPYTSALLGATPDLRDMKAHLETIPGSPPFIHPVYTNCPFSDRCAFAKSACKEVIPPTEYEGNHTYQCLYPIKKKRIP